MRYKLSILIIILSSSPLSSHAQTTEGKSAREVVELFCLADYTGAHLRGDLWREYSYLLDEEWEWEPGWDTVSVISSYEIVGEVDHGDTTVVQVRYHVLGRASINWEAVEGTVVADRNVVKTPTGYKIGSPVTMSFVSPEDVLAHYERIRNRRTPTWREGLIDTLRSIVKTRLDERIPPPL